jgi:replicative DNA helicase
MAPRRDVNPEDDTTTVSPLKTYSGDDKIVSFAEIAERIKNGPDELKIYTGWEEFDKLIKGFRPQQLVVVSALTKSGKTQWCMDLTSKVSEFNPVWLPFEESADELVRKYLERGMEPPHGYTPNIMRGGELKWIEERITEATIKYGSKMVFIDQLDFIVPLGGDNHALRVGEAMRTLKGIAKKLDVVIVLICHLVKAKMETTPTLEDLKGSSSIGQEADTVILLWREAKREKGQMVVTNNTIVSVQANRRHGTTGYVTMVFDGNRFIEREWRQEELVEEQFNDW